MVPPHRVLPSPSTLRLQRSAARAQEPGQLLRPTARILAGWRRPDRTHFFSDSWCTRRLQIYIDAGHSTVCDINALLSCGTVMRTPRRRSFRLPNPFIGLVGFSDCGDYWRRDDGGCTLQEVVLGVHEHWFRLPAFIMWLWYQTTFQINALCLFCMIVVGYDYHAVCRRPRSAIFRRVLFRLHSRCVRALAAGPGLRLACG